MINYICDIEEFEQKALDLDLEIEKEDDSNITYFLIDDVESHISMTYIPSKFCIFRYWSDDILCDRLRLEVLNRRDSSIALDYLELLSTLERK